MEWYINKEKAIENIKRKRPKVLYSEYGVGYERGLEDAVGLLNATPSEDVQPVKHGAWRKDEQGYDVYVECSECGLNLSTSNYIENEWREILKYCPYCGARMDLKDGDAK